MRQTKHGKDSRKFFDWLEISARDLLAAQILIKEEQCYDIAGFHCQQCIEKSLKAYIIDRTGMLVDGHNLTWLCRQALKYNPVFGQWVEKTAQMNRLYIETRYPSDIDLMFDEEKILGIYETAREIYNFVCDQIYGGDGSLDDDD